jgi:hypothetical protein
MSMKLNRAAYEKLVAEDVAWLELQPRTLERDHIIMIVKQSTDLYYAEPLPCRGSTPVRDDGTICTDDSPCDACALQGRGT